MHSPIHPAPRLSAAVLALTGLLLGGCASQATVRDEWAPVVPAMAVPTPPVNGAIYQTGHNMALFGDVKARNIGDIITVILTESTTASKSASTSTEKETSLNFGVPTLFGQTIPEGQVGASNETEFSGSGSSSQRNQLSGSISVTVAQRMPNGNLLVRGEKRLRLNQGEEFVRIEGFVRPADVTPNNTVASTQIADARIIYSGKGALADSNRQGWLSRFFNSALWPF